MKTRNLGDILDKISDFEQTKKNDILDKIFLVSLNMLVAQYEISADIKSTLITFQWKQVYSNTDHFFLQTWKSVHIFPFAN